WNRSWPGPSGGIPVTPKACCATRRGGSSRACSAICFFTVHAQGGGLAQQRAAHHAGDAALGVNCEVRDLSYDELMAAEEVFLCNSVYGVWPVRRLEARAWLPGPLTRKLQ